MFKLYTFDDGHVDWNQPLRFQAFDVEDVEARWHARIPAVRQLVTKRPMPALERGSLWRNWFFSRFKLWCSLIFYPYFRGRWWWLIWNMFRKKQGWLEFETAGWCRWDSCRILQRTCGQWPFVDFDTQDFAGSLDLVHLTLLVGGFKHFLFSINGKILPNWRTPSFFRGVGIPPSRSDDL
jgi:hypothetical protein